MNNKSVDKTRHPALEEPDVIRMNISFKVSLQVTPDKRMLPENQNC